MQTTRIYYERNFPLNQPFLFEKYGMEVTINPGETEEQAYAYAIEAIHAAHKACHPIIEINTGPETPPIQIQLEKPISEDQRVASIINGILLCTTMGGDDGLFSFKGLVLRENNPEITAAYDEMLKKLS